MPANNAPDRATEDDALEAAAREINQLCADLTGLALDDNEKLVAIMRRHGLRGPEQWICDDCGWVMAINKESCWNCDAPRAHTTTEDR